MMVDAVELVLAGTVGVPSRLRDSSTGSLKNENGDIRDEAAHLVGARGVKTAVPS